MQSRLIVIKSARDIEMMRRAGALAHEVLQIMHNAVAPGVSTAEIDEIARVEMEKAGAQALSKNYPKYQPGEGFPGYTCISVNEVVVHGIPGPQKLKEGDVVTLDLAINNIRPGKRWSEIARLVQYNVERNGFNVVREFVGHGIGREMHEEPKVPNFVTAEQLRADFLLRRGMTLAVEPMVVMGSRDVDMLPDGWTIYTKDRMPAAHFEHTVAVTETGVDVLTDGRAAVPASATGS